MDTETLIRLMVEKAGHNGALGVKIASFGENWVECYLDWRDDLVSDPATGILASGPILSLMDTACGVSMWRTIKGMSYNVTLNLKVDYLRPARPGHRVTGWAETYHVTKRIAFTRGTAHDGDPERPIATVSGSFMFGREDGE